MNEHQVNSASRIAALIVKKMQTGLTIQEQAELEVWQHEQGENFIRYEELMQPDLLQQNLQQLDAYDEKTALQKLKAKLQLPAADTVIQEETEALPAPVTSMRWRYLAAAAIVLLLAGGIIFYYQRSARPALISKVPATPAQPVILPGSTKATLILENGTAIPLNPSGDSTFVQGNATRVVNENGVLAYSNTGDAANTLSYNTVLTPKGGEYKVVLDDGTRVWLNAGSSLRYPTRFTGAERRVFLQGEAYFSVAKNKQQPFIVTVDKVNIQALGTQFNVMAYAEENRIETSLAEGLVKVSKEDKEQLLEPGKKAVIRANETAIRIEEADLEQVTAWKEGLFIFRNNDIHSIMNELSRWYDIEVIYGKQPVPSHFSGEIRKQVPISQVLKMLELTGGVRFSIKEHQVTVLPGII